MGSWKQRFAWLIVSTLAIAVGVPAMGQGCGALAILNRDTYGPGESIQILTGYICFIPSSFFGGCTACPPPGVCDDAFGFNYSARAYIVPHGTTNLAGRPYTVVVQPTSTTGLNSSVIGFTLPIANGLGDGQYDVIFDECENGVFDPGTDEVGATFRVQGASGAPPGTGISQAAVNQMKANAQQQANAYAQQLVTVAELRGSIEWLEVLHGFIGMLRDPALGFSLSHQSMDVFESAYDAESGLIEDYAFRQIILAIRANVNHYLSLVADPPDPAFQVTVKLDAVTTVFARSESELDRSCVDFANAASREAAANSALLHAIEKFQGAAMANNRLYALKQARAVRLYAGLVKELAAQCADAASRFNIAQAALPDNIDAGGAHFAQLRDRLASGASGFSPAESAFLVGLGLSATQRDSLATYIRNQNATATTRTDLAASTAALVAATTAGSAEQDALIASCQTEIAALSPQVVYGIPIANAGGPYTVAAGTNLVLTAADTTDSNTPRGSLAFAWDLNEDGVFGDATGVLPTVSFPTPGIRRVAVVVTDPEGNSDVAYALVTVTSTNHPPAASRTPPQRALEGTRGSMFDFSVATTDPDNDPLTVTWYLNDSVAATGTNTFRFSSTSGTPLGFHRVRAVIGDNSPSSPDAMPEWLIAIADVPRLHSDSPSLDFGPIAIGGNGSLAGTWSNTGAAPLRLFNFRISGPNAGDYTLVGQTPDLTLPPNGTTSVTVRFTPVALGARTAAVECDTNDLAVPTASLSLLGTGSSACSLADITGIGGPPEPPDGLLTGDDFNAFIGAFAAGSALADVTGIGGPPSAPDGLITGDDFNAFIAAFANGCP